MKVWEVAVELNIFGAVITFNAAVTVVGGQVLSL